VAELDEVELELAAAGEPVRLRPRERRVVVGRLIEQGHTAREVAARLGISRRAVQSHLAILRRTAAAQLERGTAA